MTVGEEVTVVLRFGPPDPNPLMKALVTKVWPTKGEFDVIEFEVIAAHDDRAWTAGRKLVDEGVTWCRGHSGPAVDALAAAQALT